MTEHMKAIRLFLCVASLLLITRIHSINASNASSSGIDTVVIKGDDIEDIDDSQDIFSNPGETAIKSTITHRDTLRTYTLNGVCIKGSAKKQPSRTLYNIIIKNGRKVLKR